MEKDLVHSVLSFLRLPDLVNCRVVSQLFLQIVDNFVRFSLIVTTELYEDNKLQLDRAIEIFKELPLASRNKITFVNISIRSVDLVKANQLIQLLPNLRMLELNRFGTQSLAPTEEFIDELIRRLPSSIYRLKLSKISLKSQDSLSVSLNKLSIHCGKFYYDNLARLSSLRKLNLSSAMETYSDIFLYLPTSLTSLSILHNSDVTSLEGLQRLRNLKTLGLAILDIQDKDFHFIPQTLQKLTLQDLNLTSKECFTMLPPNLTALEINGSNYNVDEAAPHLPTSLKKFIIANCQITLSAFNFPTNLSCLSLNAITVVGDLTFERFPKKLRRISTSYLAFNLHLIATLPETVSCVLIACSDLTFWPQLDEVIQELKEMKRRVIVKVRYFAEDNLLESEWKTWD